MASVSTWLEQDQRSISVCLQKLFVTIQSVEGRGASIDVFLVAIELLATKDLDSVLVWFINPCVCRNYGHV